MKKKVYFSKKLLIFAVSLILILLLIGIVWNLYIFLLPPSEKSAKIILNNDNDLLQSVAVYLEQSDCDSLYFHKYIGRDSDTVDDEILKDVDELFKRGYKAVGKSGNTIFFLRWTRWRDFGAGIAYSIDNNSKPQIDYMVKLEKLHIDGWYYYESN